MKKYKIKVIRGVDAPYRIIDVDTNMGVATARTPEEANKKIQELKQELREKLRKEEKDAVS